MGKIGRIARTAIRKDFLLSFVGTFVAVLGIPAAFVTLLGGHLSVGATSCLTFLAISVSVIVNYVIENRQGLTAILGDIGLGKSTVLRYLLGQYVGREDVVTALIPSPNFPSHFAFLKSLCGDFGLQPRRSMVDQEQELRGFLVSLYTEDKTAVIFIDESQRLTGKMLELVRVLLNFETEDTKLIQIVLAGQLELRTKLMDPSKRAIRSRIFAPSLLAPLSLAETREMVAFRCEQAQVTNPFPDITIESVYAITGGVPRDVLKVCAVAWDMSQLNGDERVQRSQRARQCFMSEPKKWVGYADLLEAKRKREEREMQQAEEEQVAPTS